MKMVEREHGVENFVLSNSFLELLLKTLDDNQQLVLPKSFKMSIVQWRLLVFRDFVGSHVTQWLEVGLLNWKLSVQALNRLPLWKKYLSPLKVEKLPVACKNTTQYWLQITKTLKDISLEETISIVMSYIKSYVSGVLNKNLTNLDCSGLFIELQLSVDMWSEFLNVSLVY